MDDILITRSSLTHVKQFVYQLQASFALKDLGNPSYFLRLELNTTPQGVLLSQQKYITEILHKACMDETNPTPTPMVKGISLSQHMLELPLMILNFIIALLETFNMPPLPIQRSRLLSTGFPNSCNTSCNSIGKP